MVFNMGMGLKFGPTVLHIRDTGKIGKLMVKVNFYIVMAMLLKVNGSGTWCTVTESI